MSNILDFQKFKQEKDRELKAKQLYNKLRGELPNPVIHKKDEYDYTFLQLLDIFLQEEYPEAFWRFDLFLEKIEKDKK